MKRIITSLLIGVGFLFSYAQYTIPYYSQKNCQSPKDQSSINCGNWENSKGSFRFTKEIIYHSGNKYIIHDVQIIGSDMKFVAVSYQDSREYRFLVDVKNHIMNVLLPYNENSQKINYLTHYKFNPEEVVYE